MTNLKIESNLQIVLNHQNRHFMTKYLLEQECQPPKDVENEKFLRSKNLSKENKKI